MKLSLAEKIQFGLSVFIFLFTISGIIIHICIGWAAEEPLSFIDNYMWFYAGVILEGPGHFIVLGLLICTIMEIVKVFRHQASNIRIESLVFISLNILNMSIICWLFYSIMSRI
jgi:uncharacterized integral membrane protein